MSTTPTIDQFLSEIALILRAKDGAKLRDYLILEPPLPPLYEVIVAELRQAYSQPGAEERLEAKCRAGLPEYDDTAAAAAEKEEVVAWPVFVSFLCQYFLFLRSVNPEQLVETHELLKALLK